VNGTGGNEGMNPGPLGVLHCIPRRPNIILIAPGEAADDGDVPFLIDGVTDVLGDGFDGLEVVLGGGWEAGLDNVNAELGELPGDVDLLLGGQGGARGLLAVAESGVEDADVVGVRDAVGDVIWAAPGGRLCGCWRRRQVILVGTGDGGFSGAGVGERWEGGFWGEMGDSWVGVSVGCGNGGFGCWGEFESRENGSHGGGNRC